MQYATYLQTDHWRKTRVKKLSNCNHCQICDFTENLHIHHKRYEIGEKEANNSMNRGLSIEPGSVLGREKGKDLMVLCASCHTLWHFYFKNRFLTHKKTSQIRRLIKLGVVKNRAFWVTKENHLYTPVLLLARQKYKQAIHN